MWIFFLTGFKICGLDFVEPLCPPGPLCVWKPSVAVRPADKWDLGPSHSTPVGSVPTAPWEGQLLPGSIHKLKNDHYPIFESRVRCWYTPLQDGPTPWDSTEWSQLPKRAGMRGTLALPNWCAASILWGIPACWRGAFVDHMNFSFFLIKWIQFSSFCTL